MRVKVDNISLGNARHVSGPLYVLPWQPSAYASDIHQMQVEVTVSKSRNLACYFIYNSIKINLIKMATNTEDSFLCMTFGTT